MGAVLVQHFQHCDLFSRMVGEDCLAAYVCIAYAELVYLGSRTGTRARRAADRAMSSAIGLPTP